MKKGRQGEGVGEKERERDRRKIFQKHTLFHLLDVDPVDTLSLQLLNRIKLCLLVMRRVVGGVERVFC